MSEWHDSQKKTSGDFRNFLQEHLDNVNARHKELKTEATTKLAELKSITPELKRGENVQNRQLKI